MCVYFHAAQYVGDHYYVLRMLKLGKVISQRLRIASGKLREVSHLIIKG